MSNRPNFSEIKSYDEFIKYYWYANCKCKLDTRTVKIS